MTPLREEFSNPLFELNHSLVSRDEMLKKIAMKVFDGDRDTVAKVLEEIESKQGNDDSGVSE